MLKLNDIIPNSLFISIRLMDYKQSTLYWDLARKFILKTIGVEK